MGTIVYDDDTDEIIADLSQADQIACVARWSTWWVMPASRVVLTVRHAELIHASKG